MMDDSKKVGAGFGVILLKKDGTILLGKRHFDPQKADSELHGEGTWTLPGGKLEFGETFEVGAGREVKEETGIELDKNNIKLISVSNDRVTDAHFITVGFVCDSFSGEARVMEPDEITEWGWYDLNNLPQPLFFPSEKMINNYKEGKLYQP
ncbi:MAG TPA: NUDIX domain-containing protein [Candidatus Paceibacterota bacterium]